MVHKLKGDAWKRTQARNFTINKKSTIFIQFGWYSSKITHTWGSHFDQVHKDCKKLLIFLLTQKLLVCALFYASPFKWIDTMFYWSIHVRLCKLKARVSFCIKKISNPDLCFTCCFVHHMQLAPLMRTNWYIIQSDVIVTLSREF